MWLPSHAVYAITSYHQYKSACIAVFCVLSCLPCTLLSIYIFVVIRPSVHGARLLQLATRMATATYGNLQEFNPDVEGIAAYLERAEIYFKANDIAESKQEPANFTLFRVGEARSHGPIVVTVEVNQQPLEMELDTGAAVSIISTSTKDQMFPSVPLISTSTILTTYTGEQMAVAGKMEVEVRYGEQSAVLTLHVVEGVGANLLGRDWLGYKSWIGPALG